MNIKEASLATGLSKDMIRFYEKEGLIKPNRNIENQYRDYTENDCYLLVMIKLYSSLGIELKQIRSFMQNQDMTLASSCIEKSIEELEQEKVILDEKIKNARSLALLLNTSKEYEITVEDNMYFYPLVSNTQNNMPELFKRYGAGIPICKINISSKEYTYEQGFLFHKEIKNMNMNYTKLNKGTYCNMSCKVRYGELIPSQLLEPKLEKIRKLGYKLSNEAYTYLIMGTANAHEYETIYTKVRVEKE